MQLVSIIKLVNSLNAKWMDYEFSDFDPDNGLRLFLSFYLVLLRFVHSFFGEETHATLKITGIVALTGSVS